MSGKGERVEGAEGAPTVIQTLLLGMNELVVKISNLSEEEKISLNANGVSQLLLLECGLPPSMLPEVRASISARQRTLESSDKKASEQGELEKKVEDEIQQDKGEAEQEKNLRSLNWIICDIALSQSQHRLAALAYSFKYFYFMFLPSITLTAVTAILGFLSNVESLDTHHKDYISILVGCLGTLSTLWQSLQDQTNYNSKAAQHDSAASELTSLKTELGYLQYKNDSTGDGSSYLDSKAFNDQLDKVKDKRLQVLASCKSKVPVSIQTIFENSLNQISIKSYVDGADDDMLESEGLNDALSYITRETTRNHCRYCHFWPWSLNISIDAKILTQDIVEDIIEQIKEVKKSQLLEKKKMAKRRAEMEFITQDYMSAIDAADEGLEQDAKLIGLHERSKIPQHKSKRGLQRSLSGGSGDERDVEQDEKVVRMIQYELDLKKIREKAQYEVYSNMFGAGTEQFKRYYSSDSSLSTTDDEKELKRKAKRDARRKGSTHRSTSKKHKQEKIQGRQGPIRGSSNTSLVTSQLAGRSGNSSPRQNFSAMSYSSNPLTVADGHEGGNNTLRDDSVV